MSWAGAMLDVGIELLVKHFMETSCLEKNAENFQQFLLISKNPNVILLKEVVLDYILGYFMIKAGVRACNFGYFMAGKALVLPLLFARNHPLYRKLTLYGF